MIETRHEPSFLPAHEPHPQVRARRKDLSAPVALAALAIVAAVVWLLLPDLTETPPAMPAALNPAPDAPEMEAPAAATTTTPPPLRAPVPDPQGTSALLARDVEAALADTFGRTAVLRFLQASDFPRRFVATVDGLGREHAPVTVWPVFPTPGAFSIEGEEDARRIAAANSARYAPLVDFATSLDAGLVANLYRRMYPVLQQAYRDLGFGGLEFNDRLIEVIDLLLATPEPAQPPEVVLTEVKGPFAPVRPWTQYEFADARLQSLTAGQKILLRVGPEQRQRLKQQLRALRAQLVPAAEAGARR
ncbi:MAG TPA: DUF3014 domain-containing protein [Ramlibacter sp.]|uniref:DUF3014 domain-containing protein n=1 Tax=Ramlibacter sp. TaxID=1917967 RepID=UPI002D7E82FF|nr:DUF3014 domain-containing protein [Ramlibacter sp.]HET8745025.1 DUF3014 domain-containing protein [Ramlibacter sp.]